MKHGFLLNMQILLIFVQTVSKPAVLLGSVQIATDSAAYYEKEAKKLYQVLYKNNISYQYQFEE